MSLDLQLDANTQYIKQGSDMWHSMRNKARVTGSTLRNAIGLNTLAKQKDHFYEKVLGRTPPPTTPNV